MTRPHWLRVGARAVHVAAGTPKGEPCTVASLPYDTSVYVVYGCDCSLIELVPIASLNPAEPVKPPKARRGRRGG